MELPFVSLLAVRRAKATSTVGRERSLLLEIAMVANIDGVCDREQKWFAKAMNCSVRSVQRWMASLQKSGDISIHERFGRTSLIIVTAGLAPVAAGRERQRVEAMIRSEESAKEGKEECVEPTTPVSCPPDTGVVGKGVPLLKEVDVLKALSTGELPQRPQIKARSEVVTALSDGEREKARKDAFATWRAMRSWWKEQDVGPWERSIDRKSNGWWLGVVRQRLQESSEEGILAHLKEFVDQYESDDPRRFSLVLADLVVLKVPPRLRTSTLPLRFEDDGGVG